MTEDEVERARWEGFIEGINAVYEWLIMQEELSLAEALEEGVEGFNRTEKKENRIKLDHVPYPLFN